MEQLVAEARAGSKEARDRLVVENLAMAGWAAAGRVDKDDAKSCAMLGLVEACDAFLAGGQPAEKLVPYLRGAARQAAYDADRDEARHRARIYKKHGLPPKAGLPFKESADSFGSQSGDSSSFTEVGARGRFRVTSELNEAEAWAEVSRFAEDELQLAVMKLKAEGFKNKEVAQRLGLSEPKVSRTIEQMRVRWMRSKRTEELCDGPNT